MEKFKSGYRNRFRFLFILFSVSVSLIISVPAWANTSLPVLTGFYPADGAVINSDKITIYVTVKDPDKVNPQSVIMKVDGNTVSTIKQFGWIDEYADDFTTLYVYYPANLTMGNHNIYLAVKDSKGNLAEHSWSFTVSIPPKIISFSPAMGTTVTERRPEVNALVYGGAPIDPDSIVMQINGTTVNHSFDQAAGKITYRPAADLPNEKTHTVTLDFRDVLGSQASGTWSFKVNTYTEMTVPVNDTTCQSCHQRTEHVMNNCGKCHGTNLDAYKPVYPLDDCYNCHFGSKNYPAAYHSGGLPLSIRPDHPVQVTDSCVECHTKTWATGIPAYHDTVNTAERHMTTSAGCEQCHASSLTREHQQRTDADGNNLNCFTCHTSTENSVQEAVSAKDSSCSACHSLGSDGGHPAHNNGLDASCQTCHTESILSEPQFHSQNGCQVCHGESAKEIVKYSISAKNTSCFSCHEEGHNVNFIQKVPGDIPQYPGFEWTVPVAARVWAEEPWFKNEYNSAGAKMIVSNRIQNVDSADVYSWFSQVSEGLGWTKSEGPDTGSDNFTMTYTKDNRMMTVYFYGGATHEPSSVFIGYRMEILYK